MSFLKTSNSFLKKKYLFSKFQTPKKNLLFKIKTNSFSHHNQNQDLINNKEKTSMLNKSSEEIYKENEKPNKPSNNDINSYIQYIKRRSYKIKPENESKKVSFWKKLNFQYLRYYIFKLI